MTLEELQDALLAEGCPRGTILTVRDFEDVLTLDAPRPDGTRVEVKVTRIELGHHRFPAVLAKHLMEKLLAEGVSRAD